MSQGLADADRQSTAPGHVLPVEIGFLAQHGYSPAALSHAAMLAEFEGVPADEFLVKGGHIREAEFYRALAEELALPFISAPRLSGLCHYPHSILAGFAPLAGSGGFVIAPQGMSLARLLRKRHPPQGRLSVTTPSALAKAVFLAHAKTIAHRSANDLPDHAPHLSSRDGISGAQIAGVSILVLLLSFGCGARPDLVLACVGAILSPLFLGMVVTRLAATILSNPIEQPLHQTRAEDATLPVYTIIVALYREKRVVSRLIEALRTLDYPAAKLDVKLVIETDDRETPAAIAAAGLPGFIEVIVAPSGHPRTKPRALNMALPLARSFHGHLRRGGCA